MVIFIVNISRYLKYFETLVRSHHRHLHHICLCHLSLTHPLSLFSGLMVSTWSTYKGSRASSSSVKQRRQRGNGWSSLTWPCECGYTPIKRKAGVYHLLWIELKRDIDDLKHWNIHCCLCPGPTSNQTEPQPISITFKCTLLKRTPTVEPAKCSWGNHPKLYLKNSSLLVRVNHLSWTKNVDTFPLLFHLYCPGVDLYPKKYW